MEKELILKNIEENIATIKYINQYNSSIKENYINEIYEEEYPFKITEEEIKFNKKISTVTSLGHESLISLINLKLLSNNELYHLISFSFKDKNYYINFNLLKNLKYSFNEYYFEILLSLKNYKNIKEILLYLYNGFIFNNEKKFKILSLNNTLETIFNELISVLSIKNKYYKLDNKCYYFNTVDLNIYKNISYDLENIKKGKIKSLSNFLYIYNVINYKNNIKTIDIPFSPFIEETNKDLTKMQKHILNGLKYSFNYILGTAGSGKTRILSRYFVNFKHWQAIILANKEDNLPILYTSYSNSTNKIFYNHLEKSLYNKKIDTKLPFSFLDLIFYIDRNDNSNIHKYTLNSIIKRIDLKKKDIDLQKLANIKQKLINFYENNEDIEYQYELLNENIKNLENYKNNFSLEEKRNLKKIFIKLKNTKLGFFNKLFNIKKYVILTTEEIITLRKIYPFISEKININDTSFIKDILKNIKEVLLNKEEYSIYNELFNSKFENISINYDELDISTQDYYYYLLFHYFLEDNKTIEKYQKVLKKLVNNEKLQYEDIPYFKKLFMLHIGNVSDLNYFIPMEFNYYMSLVDESLLIPNYLTYSILGRSSFLTVVGDLSQMTFYHLIPKTALLAKAEELYGKNKIYYEMFLNEINNKINSFYDLISYKKTFKNNNKFYLLLDNFRYNKNIYEALFQLSDEYELYRQSKSIEIDSKINSLTPFYWEYITGIPKPIKSNLLFLESKYNSKKEVYEKIFKNIKIEDNFKEFASYKINKKITLAIITPFSSNKRYCKNIVKEIEKEYSNYFVDNNKNIYEDITILSINEVQGMEFDIVIYDTFLDTDKKEYETILTNRPQILTVAISRSKNVFFLIGKKEKFESTESDIHKNIRKVIKEKFEKII